MIQRPRIVLVDNHDSYTFNLAALLEVAGATTVVWSNDDPRLLELAPTELDALVISPGPGHPAIAADVGHLPGLLARFDTVPILGVCLGHQLLAVHVGAEVVAIEPHHGHLSTVRHDGTGPFTGLPTPFTATRYHSLAVLPAPRIRATAWAEDEVIMGLEIPGRPWWGVQFHPESVASQYGEHLIRSFLDSVCGAL